MDRYICLAVDLFRGDEPHIFFQVKRENVYTFMQNAGGVADCN